jgi:hypothetical protein
MRSPYLKTGWGAFLLYACLAVVLVAATVQATHICGLKGAAISASAQDEGGSSPSGTFCTLCMIAHSITAALVIVFLFFPLLRRAPVRFVSQPSYIPFAASFKLCVRPPPAWL